MAASHGPGRLGAGSSRFANRVGERFEVVTAWLRHGARQLRLAENLPPARNGQRGGVAGAEVVVMRLVTGSERPEDRPGVGIDVDQRGGGGLGAVGPGTPAG